MLPNLKLSYYNHFIPHPDRGIYIVYNALANSMIQVDWDKGLLLSKLNSMEIHYLDIELIELLRENSMVIDRNFDEFVEVRHRADGMRKRQEETSTLFLVVAPTNSCNMSCPYCYQGDKTKVLPEPRSVDEANIQSLKNLVTKAIYQPHAEPIKKIAVEWFGGEPLMKKNVLRDFSFYVTALADANNVEYTGSIITNGTLLNAETWELLDQCRVTDLQITIDGSEVMHNRQRMYLNGKGTYEKIMQNLSIMPKDKFKIIIRINGDKEVFENLPHLFQDLEERGLWPQRRSEISFHWAPKFYNFLGFTQEKNVYYTSFEYQKSKEDFAKMRLEYYNDWALRNEYPQRSLRVAYPSLAEYYCGTVESPNSFSVDGEGYIHKCYNSINNKAMRIQHSDELDHTHEGLNYYKNFHKTEQADCRTCKVLPICEENCNMRFITNTESKMCTAWKYFMESRMISIFENNFGGTAELQTPVVDKFGKEVEAVAF